ncbi:MAG: hypothetical protein QNK05_09850 [Myxococcota bacterium]|nr:hypothetical protein [Myxococcota bacterium]
MLGLLALAAALAFIVVGGFVGIRLLLLARRTRELPELAVGLGFLFVALIGYPMGLSSALPGVPHALACFSFGAGHIATAIGSISIFVFTWRVFRPDARWAAALSAACMLALVGSAAVAVHSALNTPVGERVPDPALVFRQLTVGVSYFWTAIEGLRWYQMLKRRLALGLADPMVANRFLLWGLSGLSAGTAVVVSTVRFLQGAPPVGDPVSMLAIGFGGFGAAISIYLAFVPPARYRQLIEDGAPAVEGA